MMHSIQYHNEKTLYHSTEEEAEQLAKKYSKNINGKVLSCKGMKNALKKNTEIAVDELISCHPTPQSSNKGEEKKDKTNSNFINGTKKASKRMIHVDGEEKTSHQQIQQSTKKTCPTSVKKITIVKTDCNRNTKQKEYNKCDKSNHKVCEMMFLYASQLLLTLPCLFLNEVSKER